MTPPDRWPDYVCCHIAFWLAHGLVLTRPLHMCVASHHVYQAIWVHFDAAKLICKDIGGCPHSTPLKAQGHQHHTSTPSAARIAEGHRPRPHLPCDTVQCASCMCQTDVIICIDLTAVVERHRCPLRKFRSPLIYLSAALGTPSSRTQPHSVLLDQTRQRWLAVPALNPPGKL